MSAVNAPLVAIGTNALAIWVGHMAVESAAVAACPQTSAVAACEDVEGDIVSFGCHPATFASAASVRDFARNVVFGRRISDLRRYSRSRRAWAMCTHFRAEVACDGAVEMAAIASAGVGAEAVE